MTLSNLPPHEFEPDIAGLDPAHCRLLECGRRSSSHPIHIEEAAGAFDEENRDEIEDCERVRIPCSICGKSTTFDPTYGDLCYRCCRADNE